MGLILEAYLHPKFLDKLGASCLNPSRYDATPKTHPFSKVTHGGKLSIWAINQINWPTM
jgi:hypothetical protein